MASASPALTYHSVLGADSHAEFFSVKTGPFSSASGRVRLVVRRRALWFAVALLASVLAPCHSPDAGQAGKSFTWQSLFVCPNWLAGTTTNAS